MNDIILFYFIRKIRLYESSLINIITKYIIPHHKFQIGETLVLNPEIKLNDNYDTNEFFTNYKIETYDSKLTKFRNTDYKTFDEYLKDKTILIKQLYFSYYIKIKKIILVYGENINYHKYIYIHYITGYNYSEEYSGEYFLIQSINIDYNNYCFEEQLDYLNKWEKIEFDQALETTKKRMEIKYYV